MPYNIKEPTKETFIEQYQDNREINLLTNPNFKILIQEAPLISLFSQTFELPSISAPAAVAATPFVDMKYHSDKPAFSDLTINFLVDENMQNYYELYAWMMHLSFPRMFKQYDKMYSGLTRYPNLARSNIYVMMLTNKTNLIDVVRFHQCFPTALGAISMEYTGDDVSHPVCSVTFSYDFFTFGKEDTDKM